MKGQDIRFWQADNPHAAVFSMAERIIDRTGARRRMDLYHACLYDDSELDGLGPGNYDLVEFEPSTLAFNVVRQNVDTLTAKIAKSRPLPMPLTTGGNYAQQRRAKLFGRAIEGQFDLAKVWETSPVIARDAALFGTGITQNYLDEKTNKIVHERVFPWEILVSPRESMYKAPRTLYRRRWVEKLVLKERYPDFETEIEGAKSTISDDIDIGYDDTADMCLVVEAWHLPSPGLPDHDWEEPTAETSTAYRDPETGKVLAHDGAYVVTIHNATLDLRPWRKDYFPFTVLRMNEPIMGWFGTGLGKILTGLQFALNENLQVAQEAFAMTGGYITVEQGSNVRVDHIDNNRGTVLFYTGTQPQWIAPNLISPEHLRFTFDLIPKSYEATGVSQLSAQGTKPAGLNSGVALSTYLDVETERFVLFSKAYERYHVDIAYQFLDLLEEMAKRTKNLKVSAVVKTGSKRVLEEMDYAKIKIDRAEYVLQVFPTSMLAREPAARLQQVNDLANAGWIGPEEAKMLLDFPDLERAQTLEQSGQKLIEKVIDRMLEAEDPNAEDVYFYPEAPLNLEMAKTMAQQRYLEGKLDGAPEENLKLVMQFMVDCTTELEAANANSAPMTPPEAPPGPPGAPPGPPPAPGAAPPEMMPPPPPMAA